MLMQPIDAETDWTSYVVLSLLRKWAVLPRSGEARLPGLVETAGNLGTSSLAAIAVGSVFELTEACLGRPLGMERCYACSLAEDEKTVVGMLGIGSDRGLPIARDMPIGLLNALSVAAVSARRLLGEHGILAPVSAQCSSGPR
ncbi:hypothetical protein [Sphingosinicella rhizophila]|uniref:Uncharacterized protein n=1 Tax=Sphingosinicella rhizophila TaxID=3050082 RepID=A0ABU3Q945_9SPHN|nr:hypothetical protein [Sphingosinicella sp. GR2756]MDT9599917.1 hypothetical protein [Sphingosinicella sp. GR2756]